MRKFFILLLVVFTQFAHAQVRKDSLNVTDAEGKRQGKWVITNKLMKPPLPGYAEDQKVEEGRYVDGKKNGIWVSYYANGNMKNRFTFEAGKPNGMAIMYNENGKIAEQGIWRNQHWVGDYKLYYENGEIQHSFKFNPNGKRDGKQVYYAENGQKIIEGEMKEGKEIGLWNEWFDNGEKRAEKYFNEGAMDTVKSVIRAAPKKPEPVMSQATKEIEKDAPPAPALVVDKVKEKVNGGATNTKEPLKIFKGEGYAKMFRDDKQISKDGEFHNYKLVTGKSYIYNENGILERIAVYENGHYKGDAPLPAE